MWRRCTGSSPVSGSSRISTSGSLTSAAATFTRWRIPLENCPTGLGPTWVRSTSSSACRAARSGSATPWVRAANSRNSPALRWSNKASCWGTSDTRPRTSRSERGLAPSTSTVPRDGGVRPHSIRNSVDLPAPLGPSSAVTPWSIAKLTSLTATTDPKNFDTALTAIIPLQRRKCRSDDPDVRRRERSRWRSSTDVRRRQAGHRAITNFE